MANIVGRCPLCGKPVFENQKNYGCGGWKDGCHFHIWKEIAGCEVTPDMAHELLEQGATAKTYKFHSRAKDKDFYAGLKLEDGEVKLVFPDRNVPKNE